MHAWFLATALFLPLGAQEPLTQVPPLPPKSSVDFGPDLDGLLLQPRWFGQPVPFAKAEGNDFFWIKPGLNLSGKTLSLLHWETPPMLQVGRKQKDRDKAESVSQELSLGLRGDLEAAFGTKAKIERSAPGDFELIGRVVDANEPNTFTKLAFGAYGGRDNLENATWDIKIIDTRTKELVLALHHRTVRVNALGALGTKLKAWSKDFATILARLTLIP